LDHFRWLHLSGVMSSSSSSAQPSGLKKERTQSQLQSAAPGVKDTIRGGSAANMLSKDEMLFQPWTSPTAPAKIHIGSLAPEILEKLQDWAVFRLHQLTLVNVRPPKPSRLALGMGSMSEKFSSLLKKMKSRPALFSTSSTTLAPMPLKPRPASVLFGVPLEVALQHASAEGNALYGLRIPRFFDEAMKYLCRGERLRIEGIFRVPGSSKRIGELRLAIDADLDRIDYETLELPSGKPNAHDITTVMKQFLRELPQPLLGLEFERICVEIDKIYDGNVRLQILQLLYITLPTPQRDLFESLIKFLHKVARHRNKMTATNLALVFAPSFLASGDNLDMHKAVVSVLRLIIIRWEDVFRVDVWSDSVSGDAPPHPTGAGDASASAASGSVSSSSATPTPPILPPSAQRTVVTVVDSASSNNSEDGHPMGRRKSGKKKHRKRTESGTQEEPTSAAASASETRRVRMAAPKRPLQETKSEGRVKFSAAKEKQKSDKELAMAKVARGEMFDPSDLTGSVKHSRSSSAGGGKPIVAALEAVRAGRMPRSQSLESVHKEAEPSHDDDISDGEISSSSD